MISELIECTEELLEKIGMVIQNKEVLAKLGEKGLHVDEATSSVKFPTQRLRELLSQIPEKITLHSYDEKNYVILGDRVTKFLPSGTGLQVIDPETGEKRLALGKDVRDLIRLQNHLDNLDIIRPMVSPDDYNGPAKDIIEHYYLFRHSFKPFIHRSMLPEAIGPIMEMYKVLNDGDQEKHKKIRRFAVCYCPVSPFTLSDDFLKCALKFAEEHVPILTLSCTLAGVTSPVTPMAQSLQTNAEIIGSVAVIQAWAPGCPIIYGNAAAPMDMKTSIHAAGAPERTLVSLACTRLAQAYKIPNMMGGTTTDAKTPDAQYGFEKAHSTLTLLNNADAVTGMGSVDGVQTFSSEQLVIDDEAIGQMRRACQDFYTSDFEEEFEIMLTKGAAASYIIETHTLQNFRANWQPDVFTRDSYDVWKSKGEDIQTRARKKALELIAKDEEFLSGEKSEKLLSIIEKEGVKIKKLN